MDQSRPVVTCVQLEHLATPLGIGTSRPRISWQIQTDTANWWQSAYEVERVSDATGEAQTTGRINSDQSVLVPWPFPELRSRESARIRVRVWGADESESTWSCPVTVEAGLLQAGDWTAAFMGPSWMEDPGISNPPAYFRRNLELRSGIARARLYVTALGVYEARLNGAAVGNDVLAPGWTAYDRRLIYRTFDVTPVVRPGSNAIGAIVAEGWFRGRIGFGAGKRNIWGTTPALLAQLEVDYEDGSRDLIVTDESWRASTGPILASSIYDGETYDARLEIPGWDQPGFEDRSWSGVRSVEWNPQTLVAPSGPPVRRTQRLTPVSVFESRSGRTLIDFGQNLVGRLSIRVRGHEGNTITLRHAEVLEDGELATRPLRHAQATDRYTVRGGPVEVWEPRFTYHGFRYAEVTGWPGKLIPDDITAVVIQSDMERTGWFECSDALLNRLHENVVWSMRGNFVSLPTDCPQRDERLGWTGDIQVFSPTATFLYDCCGFLGSWLADLAEEQKKQSGVVPAVVPDVIEQGRGAAAWADAATVVPWVLFLRYGDTGLLDRQFPSMCAWVDHIAAIAGETYLWESGFQFGDWLDPTAPPDKPGDGRTDAAIVATAYFARSARIVADAAGVLGHRNEEHRYGRLASRVSAAFAEAYVTPRGRMTSDAETAYALAIVFGLLPTADQVSGAGKRLAELVREGGFRVRTGFVGTPLICDALASTGHLPDAFSLLLQRECPSWLYPVTKGATTVWERWDSMLPDGSINPGEMTSFNHYAFGAVADFMHRAIGGLAPAEPGYRIVDVRPRPGGGLTHARARHLTPYGMAECNWRISDGVFHIHVTVPPNTRARVVLPGSEEVISVGSGFWEWSVEYPGPGN